ncbi:hypothetical protein BDZ94DRAFT_1308814 [Collybia nuda]|uniref:Uncharacterized protein n=1 Tax=Collybia nuda TaxID=64659 RepID=A0A9P5Y8L4_9AGAR|nr:hypothetical protein BDZ94DRAFT_1308814 [Collybia nuda]
MSTGYILGTIVVSGRVPRRRFTPTPGGDNNLQNGHQSQEKDFAKLTGLYCFGTCKSPLWLGVTPLSSALPPTPVPCLGKLPPPNSSRSNPPPAYFSPLSWPTTASEFPPLRLPFGSIPGSIPTPYTHLSPPFSLAHRLSNLHYTPVSICPFLAR